VTTPQRDGSVSIGSCRILLSELRKQDLHKVSVGGKCFWAYDRLIYLYSPCFNICILDENGKVNKQDLGIWDIFYLQSVSGS